jgi:hypothetical protein
MDFTIKQTDKYIHALCTAYQGVLLWEADGLGYRIQLATVTASQSWLYK